MKRSVLVAGGIGMLLLVAGINAECQLGCKVTACARNGAGQCWKADPASCFTGYWRLGGKEDPSHCEDKFPTQFFDKYTCPDCNPLCPQIDNVEATNCSPNHQCSWYPHPTNPDGQWKVRDCMWTMPSQGDPL
jgi:hypothetical protein